MKLLFVDNEPSLLHGIERMMFGLSDDWDMRFAESGEAALQCIESETVDVLVTGLQLPQMDGISLLKQVQGNYPDMVRIVLSGQANLESTLRTVPVAHQYLSKPCKAERLQEVVERTCSLRQLLNDHALQQVVGTIDSLPPLPRLYTQLTQALQDTNTDVEDVAAIISQDTAMTAKILQLVNSAFFGTVTTISTVEQAVVRLGFNMLKNLVLCTEVFHEGDQSPTAEGFYMEALQNHMLHTAFTAKKMIADRKTAEGAFMAGMLHDVGKLVLARKLPEQFTASIALAKNNHIAIHQAETELLGLSHAEIGGYLLGIWGLPHPIVEAVSNHHQPDRVPRRSAFGILEAVYTANCLVEASPVNMDYLQGMDVEDQLEHWKSAI